MLIAIIILLAIADVGIILTMFMVAAIVSNTKQIRHERITSDLIRIIANSTKNDPQG